MLDPAGVTNIISHLLASIPGVSLSFGLYLAARWREVSCKVELSDIKTCCTFYDMLRGSNAQIDVPDPDYVSVPPAPAHAPIPSPPLDHAPTNSHAPAPT